MKQESFTDEPLDIGAPVPEGTQWYAVEGRLGERIHPIGPKFCNGHVKANSLQHAKDSYQAYFEQYFYQVEVLKVTPVGYMNPNSIHVFPAKRNFK